MLLALVAATLVCLSFSPSTAAAAAEEKRVGTARPPVNPEAPADMSPSETQGFEAEVSKMLDILIHSLYTNRAIFIRELISNANDALDKVRIASLTSRSESLNQFGVEPTMDVRIRQDENSLIIRDGGIGMTREDLSRNLGTLGRSGTKAFLEHMQSNAADSTSNLIGQFGVGFYSAFLVADRVRVASKHDDSDKQFVWESKGDGSFIVYEDPRGNTLGRGTEVILDLKEDATDFKNENMLRKEIFQYSAFVQYPIYLMEKSKAPPDAREDELDEKGEYKKYERVNDVQPVWYRPIGTVTPEEYTFYYRTTTGDPHEPMYWSHFKVEGGVDFTSLLYIPGIADHQDFSEDHNLRNVKLFVRRVFISDDFRDLLPRYLNFVKGIVDSDDLPLNVSREMLQESRILSVIRRKLVRKALNMIAEIQEQDEAMTRDPVSGNWTNTFVVRPGNKALHEPTYPKLWREFGKHLRMGILEDQYNRARLARLLRYQSSSSGEDFISLQTYIERMKENQTSIYYLSAESAERASRSPIVADAVARGYEVLFFTDPIDDFLATKTPEFAGRRLMNLAAGGDADFHKGDETEREEVIGRLREARFTPLMNRLQRLFGEKDVGKVVLTKRTNTKDAFIVSSLDPAMTARMAKIMQAQTMAAHNLPMAPPMRVVELNHRHPLVEFLLERFEINAQDQTAKDVAWMLYDAASVESDFGIADSAAYFRRMNRVLRAAAHLTPNEELLPPDDDSYDVETELAAMRLNEELRLEEEGSLPPLNDEVELMEEEADLDGIRSDL